MKPLDRRQWLALAGAGLVSGSAAAAGSAKPRSEVPLGIEDPARAFRLWTRLNADLRGRVLYLCQQGMVYGFRPQADDVPLAEFARRLYGYRSGIARLAEPLPDGSVRIRSRSWFLYTDAESGAYIRTLRNPYTGLEVDCAPRMGAVMEQIHAATGRVPDAAPFPLESSDAGQPLRLDVTAMGEHVWLRRNVFSRFKPPDTNWWKLEADMLTHCAKRADVLDASLGHVPNTTSHNLVAEWQTWMKMHGEPGHILFVGEGAFTHDPRELPGEFRAAVEAAFPATLDEPLQWRIRSDIS